MRYPKNKFSRPSDFARRYTEIADYGLFGGMMVRDYTCQEWRYTWGENSAVCPLIDVMMSS